MSAQTSLGSDRWAASYAWKRRNRAHVAEYKRRRRREKALAQGRPFVERTAPLRPQERAMLLVLMVWRLWIRNCASAEWLDGYYMATGKPWSDHRLSDVEGYRLRYRLDASWRDRERARLHAKKRRHRSEIAASTVDLCPEDVRRIRDDAASCFYCGRSLNESNRTVDHMTPMSRGGLHARSNVVACCLPCNSAKQDMTAEEYQKVLPEPSMRVPAAAHKSASSRARIWDCCFDA